MVSAPAILTIITGFGFFFYMTGYKGLVLIIALFIFLMGAIYFKQNSLLYMPGNSYMTKLYRESKNPVQVIPMDSTDLSLNTSDGVIIRGWHIKSAKSQRIIIYFHENAGNIGTRIDYIKQICQRTNSDVILVAYRGYSESQSVPSQQGIVKDSYAVLQYAISYSKDHSDLPIYLLGRSLGGAVSINLASQQYYQPMLKGVVLQNTFTCIGDMIDAVLPVLKYFKFLQKNFWSSIDKIDKIKCPILFIKSMRDELVPPQHMNKLMAKATAPKKQYKIKLGTHNNSWDIEPERYFGKLIQFFNEVQNKNQIGK